MEEKELIKLAVLHKLDYLLDKKKCDPYWNEMYKNKEVFIVGGKWVVNTKKEKEEMTLEKFVSLFGKLFSKKSTGKAGHTGSKKTIADKARRFSLEEGYTYEELLKITEYYIDNYQDITYFLCNANYFFYKKEGKHEKSYCLMTIEKMNADREEVINFTEDM